VTKRQEGLMNRRSFLVICMAAPAAYAGLSRPLLARMPGIAWMGTWVGKTVDGTTVAIAIVNGRVIDYRLGGQSLPVRKSMVLHRSASFEVGESGGTILLVPTPDGSLTYTCETPQGAKTSGTLAKLQSANAKR
jgi:hypothetical protein